MQKKPPYKVVEARVILEAGEGREKARKQLINKLGKGLKKEYAFLHETQILGGCIKQSVCLKVWDIEEGEFRQYAAEAKEPQENQQYSMEELENRLLNELSKSGLVQAWERHLEHIRCIEYRARILVKSWREAE